MMSAEDSQKSVDHLCVFFIGDNWAAETDQVYWYLCRVENGQPHRLDRYRYKSPEELMKALYRFLLQTGASHALVEHVELVKTQIEHMAEELAENLQQTFSLSRKSTSKLEEAKRFLRAQLRDGPKRGNEVLANAREAGIAVKTLRRAKSELGVVSTRSGFQSASNWCLPT